MLSFLDYTSDPPKFEARYRSPERPVYVLPAGGWLIDREFPGDVHTVRVQACCQRHKGSVQGLFLAVLRSFPSRIKQYSVRPVRAMAVGVTGRSTLALSNTYTHNNVKIAMNIILPPHTWWSKRASGISGRLHDVMIASGVEGPLLAVCAA